MFHIPLTATPIGWLILGLGGYALYQNGKKRGEKEAAQIATVPAPVADSEKPVEQAGE